MGTPPPRVRDVFQLRLESRCAWPSRSSTLPALPLLLQVLFTAIRASSAESECQSVCRAPPWEQSEDADGPKDGTQHHLERLGRISSTLYCPGLLHHAGRFLYLSGLVRWYSMWCVLGVDDACQWESLPTRDTLGKPGTSLCDFTQPLPPSWLDISAIMSTLCPAGVTPRKPFGFGISFISSPRYGLRLVSSGVQFPRVNPAGDVEMLLPDKAVR